MALWGGHASRRLTTPKVRALAEFICERYPESWLLLHG
ncbi:transcriptional regulator [Serratia odorifera]|nr:transcriptional regulator [Serratia odorifera]